MSAAGPLLTAIKAMPTTICLGGTGLAAPPSPERTLAAPTREMPTCKIQPLLSSLQLYKGQKAVDFWSMAYARIQPLS